MATHRQRPRREQKKKTRPKVTKPKSLYPEDFLQKCMGKRRTVLYDALAKIRAEARDGRDVSAHLKGLQTLLGSKLLDFRLLAAKSASFCAAQGAIDPTRFIPKLSDMIQSGHEYYIDTAIECFGECSKTPSLRARKALVNKLIGIEKNGVPTETKADAGFALIDIVQSQPEILDDHDLVLKLINAFNLLLKANDMPSKFAGVGGFGSFALVLTQRNTTYEHLNLEDQMDSLAKFAIDPERYSTLAIDFLTAIGRIRLEKGYAQDVFTLDQIMALVHSLMSSTEEEKAYACQRALEIAVSDAQTRKVTIQMLFSWGSEALKKLTGSELNPDQKAGLMLKKNIIDEIIQFGVAQANSQGIPLNIEF